MLRHFITSINYTKLIQMQANQRFFIPKAKGKRTYFTIANKVNARGERTIVHNRAKALIKVYGRSGRHSKIR